MARQPLRAGVVGAGYVGLTTATCLAHLGHHVICVDTDESKVDMLRRGAAPIAEPGITELVAEGESAGRLRFTGELGELGDRDVVLLCVPTPTAPSGVADLSIVESVLDDLPSVLRPGSVLAVKSTVPVGTTARIDERLTGVAAVSNPEFLREGHAVHDFLHPDRVVIGAGAPEAGDQVAALYDGIDAPILRTDPASAELAKYASNAFLAMKASYVNVLAELCDRFGADVAHVARAMGHDDRIGPDFLTPGPGWGGSCLPKDTTALLHAADSVGVDFAMLREAVRANARQAESIVDKVRSVLQGPLEGARIGLLGLTFKAGTDDLRDSPALTVAAALADAGAVLTAYDPEVPAGTQDTIDPPVQVVDDPYLVAKDAAALVLLTEWPQFRELDWALLGSLTEHAAVVDARNLLDEPLLRGSGFTRVGVGVAGFDDRAS